MSPGRPPWKPTEKIFSAARDLERAALPQAIDAVALARDCSPIVIARLAQVIVESKDEQRVIEAAEVILNRGLGLPQQNVALLHADMRLDPEQSERAAAALERLKGYFKAGQSLLQAREPAAQEPVPVAETAPG